ncbi:hypothetical protein [Sorangium sp. So ce1182]|uniref:hypothetical protein n=1 Tax=Sorangium sp. So ce1182 TaxID=3133334 RepID=UPI003F5ECCBA
MSRGRVATEQHALSPDGPLEARDLLNQLRLTAPRERLVILLVDEGEIETPITLR